MCFKGLPDSLCARNCQVFIQVTVHEVYQSNLLVFGFSIKIMMAGKVFFLIWDCEKLVSFLLWCWLEFISELSSVTQSCLTLCNPMNRSMPGLPVHHHLSEFTQIHVHRVRDTIQPSHSRSSPSPPAPNPSQHQSLFQ